MKLPFPKCSHLKDYPDGVKAMWEETSYEYFEVACEKCYNEWKIANRLISMKEAIKRGTVMNTKPNRFGNYSSWIKDTTGASPLGYWIQNAYTPKERETWIELGGEIRDPE